MGLTPRGGGGGASHEQYAQARAELLCLKAGDRETARSWVERWCGGGSGEEAAVRPDLIWSDCIGGPNLPLAHLACTYGKRALVEELLKEKDGRERLLLQARSSDQCTAAHFACSSGHCDLVELLLAQPRGAEFLLLEEAAGRANSGGKSPASLAWPWGREVLDVLQYTDAHQYCAEGRVDALRREEAKNMDLTSTDVGGYTAAHHGAGHVEVLHYLRQAADVPMDAKAEDGSLPVHIAARRGCVVALNLLKQWTSSDALSSQDSWGFTVAHHGAGHIEVLRFLHKHRLPLNVKAKDGSTPAHAAARRGCVEALEFLMREAVGMEGVFLAADASGQTPLQIAVGVLDVKVKLSLKQLLKFSDAHFAAARGDVASLEDASKRAQDALTLQDVGGFTVAHHGAGHLAVLQHLRKAGIPLDSKADDGTTPTHWAALAGSVASLRFLQQVGGEAVLTVRDCKKRTPLAFALWNKHPQAATFLRGLAIGNGDAQDLAKTDERPVVRLQWYSQPLRRNLGDMDGLARIASICHSFLVVTVRDAATGIEEQYILEKEDSKRVGNGVLLSFWSTAADSPQNERELFLELQEDDIDPELKTGTMRDLWNVAYSSGEYQAASNCHHAARKVYNFCAKADLQTFEMPNRGLSFLAVGLDALGMPLESWRSLASFTGGRSSPGCEGLLLCGVVVDDVVVKAVDAEIETITEDVIQELGAEVPGLGGAVRFLRAVHGRYRARKEICDRVKELILRLKDLATTAMAFQENERQRADLVERHQLVVGHTQIAPSQRLMNAASDAEKHLQNLHFSRRTEDVESTVKGVMEVVKQQMHQAAAENVALGERLQLALQKKRDQDAEDEKKRAAGEAEAVASRKAAEEAAAAAAAAAEEALQEAARRSSKSKSRLLLRSFSRSRSKAAAAD
mmetsp:Transcript_64533/g.154144  ORF Transcript_64533/g.154144 Transcript_64533/m.154144 type:complete len:911 (+) Transcript_64533:133-2865(+)